MVKDLKRFLLRGNVVDLAVAVVIGAAFGLVVKAFTDGVLMPFIAAIFGGKQPNFDEYTLALNGSVIRWGSFLTAVVNFVIIGVSLFVVVKVFEKLSRKEEETAGPTEAELLTEIRDLLQARGGEGA